MLLDGDCSDDGGGCGGGGDDDDNDECDDDEDNGIGDDDGDGVGGVGGDDDVDDSNILSNKDYVFYYIVFQMNIYEVFFYKAYIYCRLCKYYELNS